MPPVVVWRMCMSTSQQGTKIKPSLGGMLASILLHRVPRMRQKVSSAGVSLYASCCAQFAATSSAAACAILDKVLTRCMPIRMAKS